MPRIEFWMKKEGPCLGELMQLQKQKELPALLLKIWLHLQNLGLNLLLKKRKCCSKKVSFAVAFRCLALEQSNIGLERIPQYVRGRRELRDG